MLEPCSTMHVVQGGDHLKENCRQVTCRISISEEMHVKRMAALRIEKITAKLIHQRGELQH